MILRRAAALEAGTKVRFPDGSVWTIDRGPFSIELRDLVGFDCSQQGKILDRLRTMTGEVVETKEPPKRIQLELYPDDLLELSFSSEGT